MLTIPRAPLQDGATPLHIAAESCGGEDDEDDGGEAMVLLLLEHSADVTARVVKRGADCEHHGGRTPLHVAALGGNSAVVLLLLEHGSEVSAKGCAGKTPLHVATERGHDAVVRILLQHGADVTALDNKGATPLHHAAYDEVVLLILLQHGAEVSARSHDGDTPLHWAVQDRCYRGQFNHEAVVRLLLHHGADVLSKNIRGETPLQSHLNFDYSGGYSESLRGGIGSRPPRVTAQRSHGWSRGNAEGSENVEQLLRDWAEVHPPAAPSPRGPSRPRLNTRIEYQSGHSGIQSRPLLVIWSRPLL